MDTAGVALASVAIGWVLSTFTEFVRRRWAKADRVLDLKIARAEQCLTDIVAGKEWANRTSREVFTGAIHVEPPLSLLRATGIVPAYFPHLLPMCERVGDAIQNYMVWCSETGAAIKVGQRRARARSLIEPCKGRGNFRGALLEPWSMSFGGRPPSYADLQRAPSADSAVRRRPARPAIARR